MPEAQRDARREMERFGIGRRALQDAIAQPLALAELAARGPGPGVMMSFDDFYVDDWFALRPMFVAHGARLYVSEGVPCSQMPWPLRPRRLSQAFG